eukprot:3368725-Amphidinium_carterae.1
MRACVHTQRAHIRTCVDHRLASTFARKLCAQKADGALSAEVLLRITHPKEIQLSAVRVQPPCSARNHCYSLLKFCDEQVAASLPVGRQLSCERSMLGVAHVLPGGTVQHTRTGYGRTHASRETQLEGV